MPLHHDVTSVNIKIVIQKGLCVHVTEMRLYSSFKCASDYREPM